MKIQFLDKLFAGFFFDMRPAPTGNPDLDELLLYNYQATACDLCGGKPAHRHAEVRHCDACCLRAAAATVRRLEAGQGGGGGGGSPS